MKERFEVILWNDYSKKARELAQNFLENGYSVSTYFSGSNKPVAITGGTFVSGYSAIRQTFDLSKNVSNNNGSSYSVYTHPHPK